MGEAVATVVLAYGAGGVWWAAPTIRDAIAWRMHAAHHAPRHAAPRRHH